eukprot:1247834-Pleurochrysis_carterae.AAC.2
MKRGVGLRKQPYRGCHVNVTIQACLSSSEGHRKAAVKSTSRALKHARPTAVPALMGKCGRNERVCACKSLGACVGDDETGGGARLRAVVLDVLRIACSLRGRAARRRLSLRKQNFKTADSAREGVGVAAHAAESDGARPYDASTERGCPS